MQVNVELTRSSYEFPINPTSCVDQIRPLALQLTTKSSYLPLLFDKFCYPGESGLSLINNPTSIIVN